MHSVMYMVCSWIDSCERLVGNAGGMNSVYSEVGHLPSLRVRDAFIASVK